MHTDDSGSTVGVTRSGSVCRQPILETGDHMTAAEFHDIYSEMPEHFKAELIGGVVYVASPLRIRHGASHPALSTVFFAFKCRTPGVEMADNATIRLGHK